MAQENIETLSGEAGNTSGQEVSDVSETLSGEAGNTSGQEVSQ